MQQFFAYVHSTTTGEILCAGRVGACNVEHAKDVIFSYWARSINLNADDTLSRMPPDIRAHVIESINKSEAKRDAILMRGQYAVSARRS